MRALFAIKCDDQLIDKEITSIDRSNFSRSICTSYPAKQMLTNPLQTSLVQIQTEHIDH